MQRICSASSEDVVSLRWGVVQPATVLLLMVAQKQPAENLLCLETYKKWACAEPSEKKVIAILQVR